MPSPSRRDNWSRAEVRKAVITSVISTFLRYFLDWIRDLT